MVNRAGFHLHDSYFDVTLNVMVSHHVNEHVIRTKPTSVRMTKHAFLVDHLSIYGDFLGS